jgi:hypothetical protein
MDGVRAAVAGTNEATWDTSGTAEGDGKASFSFFTTPVCISAIDKGIPVPKAWPIDNGILKDSYLFVFHLLPQKATRTFGQDGEMTVNVPATGMPKCIKDDGLSFKFVSSLEDFMIHAIHRSLFPSFQFSQWTSTLIFSSLQMNRQQRQSQRQQQQRPNHHQHQWSHRIKQRKPSEQRVTQVQAESQQQRHQQQQQ